jgi:hypothetical protein
MDLETQDERALLMARNRKLEADLREARATNERERRANGELALTVHELRSEVIALEAEIARGKPAILIPDSFTPASALVAAQGGRPSASPEPQTGDRVRADWGDGSGPFEADIISRWDDGLGGEALSYNLSFTRMEPVAHKSWASRRHIIEVLPPSRFMGTAL